MTGLYDRLAATSLRLLAKNGQPVTLTTATQGGYDPSQGTRSISSSTTDTAFAVEISSRKGAINGTNIEAGDKVLLVSPGATIRPDLTQVVIGGAGWTIKAVEPLSPGGTVLAFTVLARKR